MCFVSYSDSYVQSLFFTSRLLVCDCTLLSLTTSLVSGKSEILWSQQQGGCIVSYSDIYKSFFSVVLPTYVIEQMVEIYQVRVHCCLRDKGGNASRWLVWSDLIGWGLG